MTNFLSIIVAAALVNNVVLVQFVGISSLFAFTQRLQNAVELALFNFLILFVSALVNLCLFRFILEPLALEFLKLIVFVGVSSSLSFLLIRIIGAHFPLSAKQQTLEFYLVSASSAVIGVSLLNTVQVATFFEAAAYSFGAALGFALILIAFAALNLRLESADVPTPFRGSAIQLVSAGIVAMCLMGFAGLV